MTPGELQQYLHAHIPLSKAMQVAVAEASPQRVVLTAPLAPNINHRDTVFGGSASAVAILAAWTLLHTRISAEGIRTRLVIQRNTMDYDLPIAGDFSATAEAPEPAAWAAFLRMLTRKGQARITIHSVLAHEGQVAGRLEGQFVALGSAQA